MTTSENSVDDNTVESRGFVTTVVGGLVGATIGFFIGMPIANFSTQDSGLEGIATALLILFLGLCVGAALGVGIALRFGKKTRPLATALLTMPAVFIAVYIGVFVATRLTDTDVILVPFLVMASILALLAARAVATAGRSRNDPVRED